VKEKVTAKQIRSALSVLGSLGGKASAKAMTPAQRTARARKAGKARQAIARSVRKGGRQ
jgi:hypothetical protein